MDGLGTAGLMLPKRGRRRRRGLAGPVGAGRLRLSHSWARRAGRGDDRYRRRQRWPPGRALVAAHLEGERGTVRIADVDAQAVLDVDHGHALVVDKQPVEAAVVDGDPSALLESHNEMRAGNQGMCHADVGAKVTPDRYIVARGERALGSVVPHGQHRWGCSGHHNQLYRQPRESGHRIATRQPPRATALGDGFCDDRCDELFFGGCAAGNPPSLHHKNHARFS